jgi:hypothetical protein
VPRSIFSKDFSILLRSPRSRSRIRPVKERLDSETAISISSGKSSLST